jgi:hypothetical protein
MIGRFSKRYAELRDSTGEVARLGSDLVDHSGI